MNGKYGVRAAKRHGGANIIFNLMLTVIPVLLFYGVYVHVYLAATFWGRGNYVFMLMYAFLLVLLMVVYSGYRVRQFRTRELIFSFVLASVLTNAVAYLVMCLIARRMLQLWGVVLVTAGQWIVELGIYIMSRILLPMLEPDEPVIYIRDESDDVIVEKLNSHRSRFSVGKIITSNHSWRELMEAIRPYSTVVLGDIPPETRQELIGYCFRTGRNVVVLPDMTDILINSAAPLILEDALAYDLNTQGMDPAFRMGKRCFDILAAALGLVILSPIMLITAAAVKLQDGGPVFYRQVRLTEGGKKFKLTKFRSMIVNAESATGAVLAGKEDARITKVGNFIRAMRIDELPQLWNILKGDMSLVGPRPERPEFYEIICDEYPEFDYRLKVKAGLTGYAQLYGKYNTTFADKARLDMYYIQHANFVLDLQLILYTIKIIFIRESTEGVDDSRAPEAAEDETVGAAR